MDRFAHRSCTYFACLYFFLISAVPSAHAGATEWLDIQIVDGMLLVETEIGGITGLSIVDTGAQATFVNGRFLESEGLSFKKGRKIKVKGIFSESERSTYRKIPGAIFGAPLTFTNVIELEFEDPGIQFLLGANFFDGHFVQIDYPNNRMRLITRDSFDLKALKNVEAKKDPNGGSLFVSVFLNEDTKAWLLLDTGASSGILIDRDFARQLGWVGTYESEAGVTTGVISSAEMEHFRVPLLEVGPFKMADVLASVPAAGEDPGFFEKATPIGTRVARRNTSDGILGYDVLQHFVVTIDYGRGYVHFYPGEQVADQED